MTGTRVPARDSSLQDRKAPGNVSLTHPTAPPRQCSADEGALLAMPGKSVLQDGELEEARTHKSGSVSTAR